MPGRDREKSNPGESILSDAAPGDHEDTEETTNRAIWGTWSKPYDFTVTVIGYVLGIHNFWRFPFLCYKFGGAFFVPYIIVLIFLGIPMVFMEMTIGQYFSVGPTDAFRQMAPILTGVSYLLALNSMINCCLYTMMISWSRSYSSDATSCFKGWETCYQRHFYNTPECYTAEDDDSCHDIDPDPNSLAGYQYADRLFHNFKCISTDEFCSYYEATYRATDRSCVYKDGRKPFRIYLKRQNAIEEHFYGGIMGFQRKREILRKTVGDNVYKDPKLVEAGEELVENEESHSGVNMKIYSLTTWFLLVIFLYEGLLSVSAVTYVLTLLPFILLLAFTAKALSLSQAVTGMDQLALPRNFLSDISNLDMWAEAIVQGVCTTGVGTGVLVTLATFNKYHHRFMFDAYFTLFLNLLTSASACIICFCTIGHYVNYYRILSSDRNANHDEFSEYIRTESTASSIEFGYIVYTHFLTLIHDQAYASFLFFFMASSFATDSALRLVQMALDRVVASFPWLGRHRFSALLGICLFIFIGQFPMTQNGGLTSFVEYEYFTLNFLSPLVTLVEVVSFAWIYNATEVTKRAEEMRIISSKILRWYFIATLKFISPAMLIFSLMVKFAYHTRIRFNGRPTSLAWEIVGWILTSLPLVILICSITISLVKTPKSEWKTLLQPLKGKERKASRRSSLAVILQQAAIAEIAGGRTSVAERPEEGETKLWRQRQSVRFHMIPNAPLSRRHYPVFEKEENNSVASSSTSTIAEVTTTFKAEIRPRHRMSSTRDEAPEDDEVIATEGNAVEELWKTVMIHIMSYFLDWPGRFDELSEDEESSDESSTSRSTISHEEPQQQTN